MLDYRFVYYNTNHRSKWVTVHRPSKKSSNSYSFTFAFGFLFHCIRRVSVTVFLFIFSYLFHSFGICLVQVMALPLPLLLPFTLCVCIKYSVNLNRINWLGKKWRWRRMSKRRYETETMAMAKTHVIIRQIQMERGWESKRGDRQLVNFLLHESLLSVRANTNRMENVSLPFYIHFYILLPLNFISMLFLLLSVVSRTVCILSSIHRTACVKFTLKAQCVWIVSHTPCVRSSIWCVSVCLCACVFFTFVCLFICSLCCSTSCHEKVSIDLVYLRDKSNLLIGFVTKCRLKESNTKCWHGKKEKKRKGKTPK